MALMYEWDKNYDFTGRVTNGLRHQGIGHRMTYYFPSTRPPLRGMEPFAGYWCLTIMWRDLKGSMKSPPEDLGFLRTLPFLRTGTAC